MTENEKPYTPPPPPPDGSRPEEELREAVLHLRKAATLFFDRASKDPTVQFAKESATTLLRKFGETAEPLAGAVIKSTTEAAEKLAGLVEAKRAEGSKDQPEPPTSP